MQFRSDGMDDFVEFFLSNNSQKIKRKDMNCIQELRFKKASRNV